MVPNWVVRGETVNRIVAAFVVDDIIRAAQADDVVADQRLNDHIAPRSVESVVVFGTANDVADDGLRDGAGGVHEIERRGGGIFEQDGAASDLQQDIETVDGGGGNCAARDLERVVVVETVDCVVAVAVGVSDQLIAAFKLDPIVALAADQRRVFAFVPIINHIVAFAAVDRRIHAVVSEVIIALAAAHYHFPRIVVIIGKKIVVVAAVNRRVLRPIENGILALAAEHRARPTVILNSVVAVAAEHRRSDAVIADEVIARAQIDISAFALGVARNIIVARARADRDRVAVPMLDGVVAVAAVDQNLVALLDADRVGGAVALNGDLVAVTDDRVAPRAGLDQLIVERIEDCLPDFQRLNLGFESAVGGVNESDRAVAALDADDDIIADRDGAHRAGELELIGGVKAVD